MDATDVGKLAVEHLLPILATLALAVVTPLAAWLSRKVSRFLGEREAEMFEETLIVLVDRGIARAEQRGLMWAKDRGELPAGAQKLEWALEFLGSELAERGREIAERRLVDLIESRLGTEGAPGDAVEAMEIAATLSAQKVKQRLSTIPPAAGALLALTLVGCGASAFERSATTLGALNVVQTGVAAAGAEVVRQDLDETCGADLSCREARVARWEELAASVNLAASLIDAAEEAVAAWGGDDDASPAEACAAVSAAVDALAAAKVLAESFRPDIAARLPGVPAWECE